ncbi:hypothetical protein PHMEG_00026409, partial [Phytophthora megakarya]
YYRQAKNWLLDQFPQQRSVVDKTLLKNGQGLGRLSMKCESRTIVIKTSAYTKKVLKEMTNYLYATAITSDDYPDDALLWRLWYLFGRASVW